MLALTKKEGDPMRKHLAIKILSLFIALLLIVGSAHAALSPQKANLAWERISKAAGLKTDPITIEDKKEPNAWVRFSGDSYSVHVTTGLLKILDTEDQIAGILAHETGHIKLNHYGSTVGRNLLWSLLYKSLKGNQSNELLAGLGITLAESGFSREQEVEADDYAVRLAHENGEDIVGLYSAMQKLAANGNRTDPSGFNTHPPDERRLLHIKNEILKIDPNAKIPNAPTETTATKPAETAQKAPVNKKEDAPPVVKPKVTEPKKETPPTKEEHYDIDAALERMRKEVAAEKAAAEKNKKK